jgi:hypothetical protein|tara:strand:+ start:409 stop:591 length:183 start_codon:yes stop_codon:yes gene_type:complete
MSTELILIHVGFIFALVVSVWYSGFKAGRKSMVEQFMDDELFTPRELLTHYKQINKDINK